MAYFKLNGKDLSNCVNQLNINSAAKYNAQTNAAGNTVVEYINAKRSIEVGIIPLTPTDMVALQAALNGFSVTIGFLNPVTNEVEENVKCIVPANKVSYYTIQKDKVLFKAFTLTFTEL